MPLTQFIGSYPNPKIQDSNIKRKESNSRNKSKGKDYLGLYNIYNTPSIYDEYDPNDANNANNTNNAGDKIYKTPLQ